MKHRLVITTVLLAMLAGSLMAQRLEQKNEGRNLAEALNTDGTVKAGISGSFSGEGFRMGYDKNGAPLFRSADDGYWEGIGGAPPAANGLVRAIAVSGSNVYVGGDFSDAGGNINADYIARWDGSSWQALGTVIFNNSVLVISISGSDVYVGGGFTDAGGNPNADYIARWDGLSWQALGTGLNSAVYSIAVSGTDLYVGGSYTNAGGIDSADRIARWDGTSWNALGTGLGSTVRAIAVSDSGIFIGGSFNDAGGNPDADRIARWDGTSWQALGTGISNNTVNAIAVSDSGVYAGGDFTDAGGNANADRIARWDGLSWRSLGTGLNNFVNTIAVSGNDVYAGGMFTDAGGNANAGRIARWNGTTWNALGTGLNNGIVFAVTISGGDVYLGGTFAGAGGLVNTNYLARWDGSSWQGLGGTGLDNTVRAIGFSGNDVYAGGEFLNVGGNPNTDRIVRWDGSSWQGLGSSEFNWGVYAIAVSGNNVYVGGHFTDAGGNSSADYIARWDGAAWQALGAGLNGAVYAIAVSGSDVYVGGRFTDAGGNPNADYIARWDGSSWQALGTGVNDWVFAIAVSESDVYVGGNFTDAGGDPFADRFARWNGSVWQSVGGYIFNNTVYAIAVSGNHVYVGGQFNVPGSRIVRWNGSSWQALGTGLNNTVYAITISGSGLYRSVYAGGNFTNAGGIDSADYMAKWNGSSWQALGSGMNNTVNAVGISGNYVYAGGSFTNAGGAVVSRFARWMMPPQPPVVTSAIPDTIIAEDFGSCFIRKLTDVFSDSNTTVLTYAAHVLEGGLTTDISGDSLYLNSVPDYNGTAIVRVTADDGSAIATDTFTVTITTDDDPPYVALAIPDTTFSEDFGQSFIRNLDDVFADPDSPELMYGVTVINDGLDAEIISDSLFISGWPDFNGQITLSVTAQFGGLSVSDTFTVTIINVNDAPALFSLAGPQNNDTLDFFQPMLPFAWNASRDIDGDTLIYELLIRKFAAGVRINDTLITEISDTTVMIDLSGFWENLSHYRWTVSVSDGHLSAVAADTFTFFVMGGLSAPDDENGLPSVFALSPNYPNPFNPSTVISYQLPVNSKVRLNIYNTLGQEVRTLVNGKQSAGFKKVIWNGRNNQGVSVSTGVYICRMQAGSFVQSRKMILVK